jgi:predicted transcriptional regulator
VKKIVALSLKVTPALHDEVRKLAQRWDRSLNWTATKLIEDGIRREKKQRKT